MKVTFNIEIDVSQYKNLRASDIKRIVKEAEQNGSIIDYISSEISGSLEEEDYNKSE